MSLMMGVKECGLMLGVFYFEHGTDCHKARLLLQNLLGHTLSTSVAVRIGIEQVTKEKLVYLTKVN